MSLDRKPDAPPPESHQIKWPGMRTPVEVEGAIRNVYAILNDWKPLIEAGLKYLKATGRTLEAHEHDRIINAAGKFWRVDPTYGDLVPSAPDMGVGDDSRAPSHYAVDNDQGLRGALVARPQADGDWLALLGLDDAALSGGAPIQANRPVAIEASGVLINSQLALRVPSGTLPGDIEDHYVKFGELFTAPDGNLYVTVERGPKIIYARTEEFADATDYDPLLEDVPVDLSNWVPANSLTGVWAGTVTFNWAIRIANVGDRACDFVIQPLHNGSPIGPSITVTLVAGAQLVTGNTTFAAPPSAGDTVNLRVTSTNWQHPSRPDPLIEGTVEASRIAIQQSGS